jgi:hypothetical protein
MKNCWCSLRKDLSPVSDDPSPIDGNSCRSRSCGPSGRAGLLGLPGMALGRTTAQVCGPEQQRRACGQRGTSVFSSLLARQA